MSAIILIPIVIILFAIGASKTNNRGHSGGGDHATFHSGGYSSSHNCDSFGGDGGGCGGGE
ncbi:hypothetical protein [Pseudalkalibacillus hwajinpoensis]|uniref:Uncharacterized protein n=1 Tax=Guptibacillus hwajinpoensis TaxID=208199 RepID=A0A4U1MNG2_9BACL|nr:hypothetical protein [Pseudalkalibacillus hwajinpoensis]TKD72301.1 hypothetical protein FBF83_05800 [Pseudalkalibacillus hwajinpoensis]